MASRDDVTHGMPVRVTSFDVRARRDTSGQRRQSEVVTQFRPLFILGLEGLRGSWGPTVHDIVYKFFESSSKVFIEAGVNDWVDSGVAIHKKDGSEIQGTIPVWQLRINNTPAYLITFRSISKKINEGSSIIHKIVLIFFNQ